MLRSNGLYREACPVCLGDMAEDEHEDGWLVCLICARSFPTSEIEAMLEPAASASALSARRRASAGSA